MEEHISEFLAELEQEALHNANDNVIPAGERECPICKQAMTVEVQHGARIDVCNDHGVWLDRGEMQSVISWAKAGEKTGRIEAIRKARKEGKISGTYLGLWSLLLDD